MQKHISLSILLIFFMNLTLWGQSDEQIKLNEKMSRQPLSDKKSDVELIYFDKNSSDSLSNFKRFLVEELWYKEDGLKLMSGPAYGPETLISLIMPKMSGFYFFPTDKDIQYYTGGEFSVFVFEVLWMSANVSGGLSYGPLTFEASFGGFYKPQLQKAENRLHGPFFHMTMTPKVGLYLFDRVWLKCGPSLMLHKKYSEDSYFIIDKLRDGKILFNYEIIFRCDI